MADGAERRILVTGASRGIGRAIALALAEPRATLLLNHRSREAEMARVADECRTLGAAVQVLRFDVGDREAVTEILVPRLAEDGPVDVLVNNAGITRDAAFPWVKPDDWDAVVRTNLGGLYAVTHAVVTGMIRRRKGRIVNLTSISGQKGQPGQAPYATTKAGIIGFTKTLALELAKRRITVNAVSPGIIETDMTSGLARQELEAVIPMRRYGTPEEVAAVVRFLASEEASYVTGQVIGVNGGFYT